MDFEAIFVPILQKHKLGRHCSSLSKHEETSCRFMARECV